jgi:hypothetical protein
MGKRIFQALGFSPTAQADNTALTSATYMAIESQSATAGLQVIEIYEGGQASASSINVMVFSRDVVHGVIPTALATPNSDGVMNSFGTSTSATTYVAAGTGPSRITAATNAKLNLSFNAFGGIVRWVAAPGEEWGIVGTATSVSGSTLSASNAVSGSVGQMGAHIVYEPY